MVPPINTIIKGTTSKQHKLGSLEIGINLQPWEGPTGTSASLTAMQEILAIYFLKDKTYLLIIISQYFRSA